MWYGTVVLAGSNGVHGFPDGRQWSMMMALAEHRSLESRFESQLTQPLIGQEGKN